MLWGRGEFRPCWRRPLSFEQNSSLTPSLGLIRSLQFVTHFAGTREEEVAKFKQAVTSWEVERYLELA